MPSLPILQFLLVVIRYLASNHHDILHVADQAIVNNQFNEDAFTNLQELLQERQMLNVLHILRETIAGKMGTCNFWHNMHCQVC